MYNRFLEKILILQTWRVSGFTIREVLAKSIINLMEEVHVWIQKDVQMDTAITYIPPTYTINEG